MSVAELPRPNGLRGRVRPGPAWRRHDWRQLRLARLAADLEAEADRHADTTNVHLVLTSCASALRTAADAITTDPK